VCQVSILLFSTILIFHFGIIPTERIILSQFMSVCNIPSHTAKCSLYSPNNSSIVTTDLVSLEGVSVGCDRRVKCLVFCVMICRSLFVHLSFFFLTLCCLSFLTLCCLSFFNLRILITFLVSSNYS
jgi:hypothetical protein